MWPMLILAGAQALEGKEKERNDRELASATQRYSPWTGLRAQPVETSNTTGILAQGYGSYLGQQQNDENAALRKQLTEAQIRALNRNPYAYARYPQGDYNARYDVG